MKRLKIDVTAYRFRATGRICLERASQLRASARLITPLISRRMEAAVADLRRSPRGHDERPTSWPSPRSMRPTAPPRRGARERARLLMAASPAASGEDDDEGVVATTTTTTSAAADTDGARARSTNWALPAVALELVQTLEKVGSPEELSSTR